MMRSSITISNSELMDMWDFKLNKDISPDKLKTQSHKPVWWVCREYAHSFLATPKSLTIGGSCKICKSLGVVCPELICEWDYEKNGNATPFTVSAGTDDKYWYKCIVNHSWLARTADRKQGRGCPFCAGRAIDETNSLQTLFPNLAAEWIIEKNDRKPTEVGRGSDYEAWWRCPDKQHEYDMIVHERTSGKNCPYCAGKRVNETNSLQTMRPDIAAEWCHELNENLKPTMVSEHSGKMVSWVCKDKHIWPATIDSRTGACGSGCPYCAGRMLTPERSLLALMPKLAKEWNYEKNGELLPEHFSCGSGEKVLWICIERHEWPAVIGSRAQGAGCPYCSGLYTTRDKSFGIIHADKMGIWHWEKNIDLDPYAIACGSDIWIWQICELGHEEERQVKNVSQGTTCQRCYQLDIMFPELLNEWHYEKNGDLKPSDVSYGSGQEVWWLCDKQHAYLAQVCGRTAKNPRGCPICNNSKGELRIFNWLNNNSILTERQKRFPDCKNKKPLPFDFYLPNKNICIEYDGEQHCYDSKWYEGNARAGHNYEDFLEIKLHDQIKTTYCLAQNIILIRIPYNKFDKIETILTENIKTNQPLLAENQLAP